MRPVLTNHNWHKRGNCGMLIMVTPMKPITFLALQLFLAVSMAEAADVSIERLEDFNPQDHKIAINIEVEVEGACRVHPLDLEETFTGLLGVFGFKTAPMNDSQLEFAVSIKGFPSSAKQPCGLRVLSMARQIPAIRMLRLSPGSTSTRYRLWTTENIVTSTQDEIQSLLQEQARKDVVAFTRMLNR